MDNERRSLRIASTVSCRLPLVFGSLSFLFTFLFSFTVAACFFFSPLGIVYFVACVIFFSFPPTP